MADNVGGQPGQLGPGSPFREEEDSPIQLMYSEEDFKRIAKAIALPLASVLRYSNDFEAAARWYRLNVSPAKRQEGPTLELRNQRTKKPKKPSELRKHRSNKPKTLSELRKKTKQVEAAAQKLLLHLSVRSFSDAPDGSGDAEQVEAAARKLLLHLGVRHLEEAPDGPADRELLTFLASYSGSSEEAVIDATARIGRFAERLEATDAAEFLKTCASKTVQEAVDFAKLLPKGHQGDIAAIEWTAHMMSLYEKITGRKANTSIKAPGSAGRGKPSGPLIRFLAAAGEALGIKYSPESWRGRIRDNQTGGRRRK